MGTPLQLIVGLGNPGTEYRHTRHNAGEDFVRLLAKHCNESLVDTPKFFGLSARVRIVDQDVRLLVPSTFMNLSGKAIAAISQFYKIPPEAILVAHDELDLAPGDARLKQGGGHGGHNGLRDTINALGNNKDFARLRIGIGHPGNAKLVSNYVLKRAPSAEQQQTDAAIEKALHVTPLAAAGEWNHAMLTLHTNS